MTHHWTLAATAAAFAMGCMAAEPDTGDVAPQLVPANGAFDGVLLPEIPRSVWSVAQAGCEGLLDASETFARAEGESGLLVAVRENRVVCVDTVDSIDDELGDALPRCLLVSMLAARARPQDHSDWDGRSDPFGTEEPTPQPNVPFPATAGQEPTPQPNEPTPQPNDPGDD